MFCCTPCYQRQPQPYSCPFPSLPQDKLSHEEQSSKWGLHKVRTAWRSAQRKVKDRELRQDIEILNQTFTRVMDCKDGVIEVAAGLGGQGEGQGTDVTP